jgi:fibronectin type 3 domain-containing protein
MVEIKQEYRCMRFGVGYSAKLILFTAVLATLTVFSSSAVALTGGKEKIAPSSSSEGAAHAQVLAQADFKSSDQTSGKKDGEGHDVYLEGIIIDADSKTARGVINIGSKAGVKKDQKFTVIRKGEPIVDPVTQKVIRIKQTVTGEVEVLATNESFSDVKITKGANEVAKGDGVRRNVSVPTGLKGDSAGFRKIKLGWNLQPEPETKGYVVYRSDSQTGEFKKIEKLSKPENVAFLDEHSSARPMEDSKAYYYKITALNTLDKESDMTSAVTVTTAGPPAPPKGFGGEAGKVRSIPLKWEAHELDVAGYRIYRGDSATGKFEMIKDVKGKGEKAYHDFGLKGSATEPKLDDAKTYYYSISAYSPYGDEGPKSQPVPLTTSNPPAILKEFTAKGWQARKVPLAWKASDDENVRGYYLYRSSEDKGPYAQIAEIKGKEKNSFMDTGDSSAFGGGSQSKLKDFTLYFYKIEAYNWAGSRSGMSEPASATTKPAPLAPESLKAVSNRPKQAPLDWRKNPEPTIKEYHIFRADDEKGQFRKIAAVPADKNYYLDDKLENQKKYFYKLQAVDVDGLESEFSAVVSGTTKSLPAQVTGLKWVKEGDKAVLKWDPNKEPDVAEYVIYKKGFLGWQKAGSTKDTSLPLSDMKQGSKEDYALSCVDNDKLEGEKTGALTVDMR